MTRNEEKAEMGAVYCFVGFFLLIGMIALCGAIYDRQAVRQSHDQRLQQCASANQVSRVDPFGRLACIKR